MEKYGKIKDFGFPKPFQNPFKMPPKSIFQKTYNFSSIFCLFLLFLALSVSSSKCLKPSKNCGFVASRAFQQCAAIGAQSNEKCPKNVSKTLPKRRPNPSKIDVKNVSFFNIDFLGFRARFWSLLGLQDGAKLG